MPKSGYKERRGFRHSMIVELDEGDKVLLDKLVEKYQPLFAGKANKVAVLRQLIRLASKQKTVPPLV